MAQQRFRPGAVRWVNLDFSYHMWYHKHPLIKVKVRFGDSTNTSTVVLVCKKKGKSSI